ncbi:MAG TPA: hypothetical protein DCG54_07570 [Anaerolineae bacterium]|jgi:hypothetical protein|nr:hypothetical protein [Anaerolineae bacterium]
MTLMLTVSKPIVKIRRGPNAGAAVLDDAKNGQEFEVIRLLDDPGQKTTEQWAKIIHPQKRDQDAYICVRLPTGTYLCNVSNNGAPPSDTNDYNRGFMDGRRDMINRMIDFLKSE